jgi:hypothetical protein
VCKGNTGDLRVLHDNIEETLDNIEKTRQEVDQRKQILWLRPKETELDFLLLYCYTTAVVRHKNDARFGHRDRWEKEDDMDAQFFFGLALIVCVFLLCFWFKKENKGKD